MEEKTLVESLQQTHPTYWHELEWHKLLLDSYAGTGGFRGSVRSPASGYWGPASEVYSTAALITPETPVKTNSYLDRHQREDEPKYSRRISLAHYRNTCEPIVDMKLSYLSRKNPTIEGVQGNAVGEWAQDVDGMGTTLEQMLKSVIRPRRAVLGWCPVMLDFSAPVPDGVSWAQAMASGIRLNLIPLFPAHMLDWQVTEAGAFEWVKIGLPRKIRPTFSSQCIEVTDIVVWYPDRVEKYTISGSGPSAELVETPVVAPNPFGRVPVVIFREKSIADDPVRGVSVLWNIAPVAKRRFNVDSELDEFLRSSVFAMLQVPTESPDKVGELIGGNGNAVPIHPESRQSYAWLSPSSDVSDMLTRRADDLEADMWRMARMENQRGKQSAVVSGIARAYEFESTNRAISDTASTEARDLQSFLRLAAVPLSVDPEQISVTPVSRFDVEEAAREIEDTTGAIALDLGPTATAELKKRLADKLLPNMPDEARMAMAAEIERAAAVDSVNVGEEPGDGADDPDEPDADEEDTEDGEGSES